MGYVQDFVHFDSEMEHVREQLGSFATCDILAIFKKIEILLFIKTRI